MPSCELRVTGVTGFALSSLRARPGETSQQPRHHGHRLTQCAPLGMPHQDWPELRWGTPMGRASRGLATVGLSSRHSRASRTWCHQGVSGGFGT